MRLELEHLRRLILEDLAAGKWPSACVVKRRAIKAYVHNVQSQISIHKQKKRFDFIASHVFDIRNRIFAIDSIFLESKSNSFNQIGYSGLVLEKDKFCLLKETKLSNLSKLPDCKVIMLEILRKTGVKKLF